MDAMKVVSLRLSDGLMGQVDELATRGKESRSDTLRALVEGGLDRNFLLEKIGSLENKLDRIMLVLEMNYQIGYIATMVACEERVAIISREAIGPDGVVEERITQQRVSPEMIAACRDKANQRLIEVVEKIGE